MRTCSVLIFVVIKKDRPRGTVNKSFYATVPTNLEPSTMTKRMNRTNTIAAVEPKPDPPQHTGTVVNEPQPL